MNTTMNTHPSEATFKFANLYETVSKVYSESSPISRIFYLAKLKGKDENKTKDVIMNQFIAEIKNLFKKIEGFNCFIIFLNSSSGQNALVLIEVIVYINVRTIMKKY
jgi:hypothetical protein